MSLRDVVWLSLGCSIGLSLFDPLRTLFAHQSVLLQPKWFLENGNSEEALFRALGVQKISLLCSYYAWIFALEIIAMEVIIMTLSFSSFRFISLRRPCHSRFILSDGIDTYLGAIAWYSTIVWSYAAESHAKEIAKPLSTSVSRIHYFISSNGGNLFSQYDAPIPKMIRFQCWNNLDSQAFAQEEKWGQDAMDTFLEDEPCNGRDENDQRSGPPVSPLRTCVASSIVESFVEDHRAPLNHTPAPAPTHHLPHDNLFFPGPSGILSMGT